MRKMYIIRAKKVFPEHERDLFPRSVSISKDVVFDDYKRARKIRDERVERLCVIYGQPLPYEYRRSNECRIHITPDIQIIVSLQCTDEKREAQRVQRWRESHYEKFCRTIDHHEGDIVIRGRKAYDNEGGVVCELEPLNMM